MAETQAGPTGGTTTSARSATPKRGTGYQPIYAIFEGGGAKGITHIGAIKALEDEHLPLAGVAGTSAGAIIAALIAVGYKADDLLSADGNNDLLKSLGLDPVSVLGQSRWRGLRRLRAWLLPLAILAGASLIILCIAAVRQWQSAAWYATLAFLISAAVMLTLLIPPFARRGLFSSDILRTTINTALRHKLIEHRETLGRSAEVPEIIRFSDIDPTAVPLCVPLKIIVSDIRSGHLVLFDRQDTCVAVADAVAASAAIPFAFTPPVIEGARSDGDPVYADGGLVSNLPAWCFAVEKRALERRQGGLPIPIFAFTLKEGLSADTAGTGIQTAMRSPMSLFTYVKRVLLTGIFGSQSIIGEFVSGLVPIELPTPLDTFDFDCTREAAANARRMGHDAAARALRRRREGQRVIDVLLSQILVMVHADIATRRRSTGASMPKLRLYVVDPCGGSRNTSAEFRVTASTNMSGDADDQLTLDPRNPAAPLAYAKRQPIYADIAGRTAHDLQMTKYEYAQIAPSLCSVICVPVFGKPVPPGSEAPEPERILCLDSTDSLQAEFNDPSFMAKLTDASRNLSPILIKEAIG